jgi:hypothetical protein
MVAPYGDVLPSWFQSYLGLEAAASLIRTYEVQFVPGLLQTADYARSVVLLGHGRASPTSSTAGSTCGCAGRRSSTGRSRSSCGRSSTRRCCAGRSARGRRCAPDRGAHRRDPAAVRPPADSPVPGGWALAAGGAFSILRFPDQELPDIVYVEQLSSALYLDKRDDVELYVDAMERLCVEADQPERTPDTLRRILKDT